jgi:nucleotide-binding universal stress UspA family protein
MTFVVPFDGSPLAQAALSRAVAFAGVTDETLVAVTVVPAGNADYAQDKGWLSADESFDRETVVERIRGSVVGLAPDASSTSRRTRRSGSSSSTDTPRAGHCRRESVVSSGRRPRRWCSSAATTPVTAVREQEPLAERQGAGDAN